jgi:hypothetical protein
MSLTRATRGQVRNWRVAVDEFETIDVALYYHTRAPLASRSKKRVSRRRVVVLFIAENFFSILFRVFSKKIWRVFAL